MGQRFDIPALNQLQG